MLHNRRTGVLQAAALFPTKRFTQPRTLRCPTLQNDSDAFDALIGFHNNNNQRRFPQLDALLIDMDNIPSQLYMFQTGQGTKNTTIEVKDVLRPWDQAWGKLATDIINQCKDL